MSETLDEFLKRGGKVTKCETHAPDPYRKHWSHKDRIDVCVGGNRKTGASKRFDQFAKAFLGRGNTSWKYGK